MKILVMDILHLQIKKYKIPIVKSDTPGSVMPIAKTDNIFMGNP